MDTLEPIANTPSTLVVGFDVTTKEAKGFDLSVNNKIFIGTRANKTIAASVINPFAQKSQKNICLISSGQTDCYDAKVKVIDDIDEFMQKLFVTNETSIDDTVIVIDGFCDFYDRISDEALMIFEKALAKNSNISVITFDSMQRLSDYNGTGLYVRLVRANAGAISGGKIDDSVATAISNEIYEIPRKFREKELTNGQAIIYSSSKMAYITVERS
jgi:ABC-type phosphate transport system ATPase subunit